MGVGGWAGGGGGTVEEDAVTGRARVAATATAAGVALGRKLAKEMKVVVYVTQSGVVAGSNAATRNSLKLCSRGVCAASVV